MSSTRFKHHVFIITKTFITDQNLPYFRLLLIFEEPNILYLDILYSLLLQFQHEKHTIKNCMYKWSS